MALGISASHPFRGAPAESVSRLPQNICTKGTDSGVPLRSRADKTIGNYMEIPGLPHSAEAPRNPKEHLANFSQLLDNPFGVPLQRSHIRHRDFLYDIRVGGGIKDEETLCIFLGVPWIIVPHKEPVTVVEEGLYHFPLLLGRRHRG